MLHSCQVISSECWMEGAVMEQDDDPGSRSSIMASEMSPISCAGGPVRGGGS